MLLPGLRTARERRCLTQRELARLAGITVPTVIAAERGKSVSVETGLRLTIAIERAPASPIAEPMLEAAEA
ncbi:MAG: helix-turn-helix transcriptional regulator [Candidatus Limnocylindrales bacterium]